MQLFLKFLAAFWVGWLVRMVEDELTATAWGGLFTILGEWVLIVFLSAFFAVAAMVAGLLFPAGIRAAWQRAGRRVLLLAVPPALVLAFYSTLGLREIEPVSHYSLMSFWPWTICHFFIVFPVANFLTKPRVVTPPRPRQDGEPLEYDY